MSLEIAWLLLTATWFCLVWSTTCNSSSSSANCSSSLVSLFCAGLVLGSGSSQLVSYSVSSDSVVSGSL
jgi:hypothetical protein